MGDRAVRGMEEALNVLRNRAYVLAFTMACCCAQPGCGEGLPPDGVAVVAPPSIAAPAPSVRAAVTTSTAPTDAATALEQAARAEKYVFLVLFKDDGEQARQMKATVAAAAAKSPAKVVAVTVDVGSPAAVSLVERFRLQGAPMPLALVVAPNGAVTGGFASTCTEEKLAGAVVSTGMTRCLGALQARKLVLLCVQNAKTTANEAALRGVQDFQKDPRWGPMAEVLTIDPASPDERPFLAQLGIPEDVQVATTVFLAPPRSLLGKYEGATAMDTFVAVLQPPATGGG